jgi:hypothetical protein
LVVIFFLFNIDTKSNNNYKLGVEFNQVLKIFNSHGPYVIRVLGQDNLGGVMHHAPGK